MWKDTVKHASLAGITSSVLDHTRNTVHGAIYPVEAIGHCAVNSFRMITHLHCTLALSNCIGKFTRQKMTNHAANELTFSKSSGHIPSVVLLSSGGFLPQKTIFSR